MTRIRIDWKRSILFVLFALAAPITINQSIKHKFHSSSMIFENWRSAYMDGVVVLRDSAVLCIVRHAKAASRRDGASLNTDRCA